MNVRDSYGSHVSKAYIPVARIFSKTAFYAVHVCTYDGRQWTVLKRFSAFAALQRRLSRLSLQLDQVSFPPKNMWGGGTDEVVAQRIVALREWMNAAIMLAPPNNDRYEKELLMFLAEDGSVDAQARDPLCLADWIALVSALQFRPRSLELLGSLMHSIVLRAGACHYADAEPLR